MAKLFRPNIAITIIAFVMAATTTGLGIWQVGRYGETSDLKSDYHRIHMEMPEITRLEKDPEGKIRGDFYHLRRAKFSGVAETSSVHLLTARYVLGIRGYKVLIPLKVEGFAYPRVLVDVGWVPDDKVGEYVKSIDGKTIDVVGRLQKPIDIDGKLKPRGEKDGFPTWMRPNPEAIGTTVPGIDPDLYVVAGVQDGGKTVDPTAYPLDGFLSPVRMKPAKHVEYALTWFGVTAALIAVWAALSFIKKPEEEAPSVDTAA